MIYLLLQMLVALSLAVLLGGAIGWLIHRTTHAARVHEMRQALMRQQSQLSQAQSEIAMLSDDYDEMHRRTQEELEALRQENQQLPFLSTNLEKSQLLVRQMMQKHEARVRDLTAENQTLTLRLKSIEDREQAHNKLQAELDSRRREKNRLTDAQADAQSDLQSNTSDQTTQATPENSTKDSTVTNTDSPESENTSTVSALSSEIGNESELSTLAQISNAIPRSSWASAPLVLDATVESTDNKTIDIDTDADPFDNVMEVGDELQRELSDASLDNPIDDISDNNIDDNSDELVDARSDSAGTEQFDFELSGSEEQLHDDRLLDGSSDASHLFDPVEQRDDLQQIFGIGPVTEKALYDMGITSYSQLATLKHHEIQSIADALHIVPGRIERDDWMGNARRQLEDVLEQL